MAFNNVIPAKLLLKGIQSSLPMHTPRFRIKEEYLTYVANEIICEQSKTGSKWSSHGAIDHPSFTNLRNRLSQEGLIHRETGWINGDRVAEEFYLNDVLFKIGDKFPSASAIKYTLERGEKHPMKKEEPKMPVYDAELHNWTIVKAYQGGLVAQGYIYNDSKGRFDDGGSIITSLVQGLEGEVLVTRNTRYLLV